MPEATLEMFVGKFYLFASLEFDSFFLPFHWIVVARVYVNPNVFPKFYLIGSISVTKWGPLSEDIPIGTPNLGTIYFNNVLVISRVLLV